MKINEMKINEMNITNYLSEDLLKEIETEINNKPSFYCVSQDDVEEEFDELMKATKELQDLFNSYSYCDPSTIVEELSNIYMYVDDVKDKLKQYLIDLEFMKIDEDEQSNQ